MAITIQQDISGYRPAYNSDYYVVSSNKTTEPNFQYVCDVYVGGNYVTRLKTFPHPTNGRGLFNPKRILESYVTKDFSLATNTFATNGNSANYYQLRFGEEYGASSSGTTIYPNLTLTGTKYFWNACFDFEDYNSFNDTPYILGSQNNVFLTNAPDNLKGSTSDRNYLYGITNTSGDIYFMNVTTFDSSGAQIDTYQIANPYQDASTLTKQFFRCGVGAANLNTLSTGDIFYSDFYTFPIIGNNVYKYNVQTSDWLSGVTSETRTYFVTDVCTKTEAQRLFFLNKLGGYDGFTFKNKTKKNTDIKRSTFKKTFGEYLSTNSFAEANTQRGITQYDTMLSDTITLVSDWITEDEAVWLEELFTSPDVYVDKDGTEVPINIVETTYETKQTAIAKLINITLSYTYSYNRYRQRF